MFATRPLNYKKLALPGVILSAFLVSCSVVPRNYPVQKPFVFKYNVEVVGNFSPEKKAELEKRLGNQLDDSIRVRTVSKITWKGIRPVLDKPPLYDSSNAERSIVFMRNLLNSLGYFRDTIRYNTVIDTVGEQYRTTVNFEVQPGKVVTIDSFKYNISQPELQTIAEANKAQALVKKGEPFARAAISVELDRLVDLYRNNGFLLFSREGLIGLWDTLDVSLLRPTFDPIEQLEILQKLQARRDTPTANLEIRLKPGYDTSRIRKYYVGDIEVYPDMGPDTAKIARHETVVDGVKVIYHRNLFKPKILPQNIYFRRGDLYDQRNYYKTINRFNSLGSWRLTNMEYFPRKGQDTADFKVYLTPAKKYSFTANIEGSRNQTAISGNLFGIGLNVGVQDRNFAKAANQASTNIRYGIETGRDTATSSKFIETRQISFSHTIFFPRPIPAGIVRPRHRDNVRTILSLNAALTLRRELYDLNTVNAAWGYEITGKKFLATLRIPNIEYSNFVSKPKLEDIFSLNPSLRNIFTDGLVSSIQGTVTFNTGKDKRPNIIKVNFENSGLLTGMIRNDFFDTNLYRFIKVDLDVAKKIEFGRSAVVLHFFSGVGYELDATANPSKKNNLPFFKQYFAGGPNSMRAWALRKLGPGSTIKDFGTTGIPDRYGDVQLEANVELRFPLKNFSGVMVNGALFTDIGNVWYLKKKAGLPEEVFSFSRLGRDLAVGIGAGLRIDFNFFVVRLDYSYKAKDPSPSVANTALQNKWFGYKLREGDQFQLGINLPFIQ